MIDRAEDLLIIIAGHDEEAARLARLVLDQRRANDGDVEGWVKQLERATFSLHSTFNKTHLLEAARKELENSN